jgi:hypothetical protein
MEEVQTTAIEAEVVQSAASVDDLGLEVVESPPQIGLIRPIRHIRAPQ